MEICIYLMILRLLDIFKVTRRHKDIGLGIR